MIPVDSSKPIAPHNTDPNTNSDRILAVPGREESSPPKSSGHTTYTGAAPEKKFDWKSTAYATTKLAINLVKESSDAFPPLKSVAGGLSAILDHCEVCFISSELCRPWYLRLSQQTIACRKTIESLMPRVERLAESLSTPIPEGEVKEEERRKILKR